MLSDASKKLALILGEGAALATAKLEGKPLPEVSPEPKAIWDGVQENHARIDGCAGPHAFEKIDPARVIGSKWRCTLCGGLVDGAYKVAYEQGREHERGTRGA